MEIKGKCIKVMDVTSGTGKNGKPWEKLDFLLEYGNEYPKSVCLTLFNKTEQAPAVGDNLTCQVSPESREYNGKYYTNMNCWKIEGFTGNLKKSGPSDGRGVFDEPSSPIGGKPAHERIEPRKQPNENIDTSDLPF